MQDDLFRPTIRERPVPGAPPWRPQSIAYPAFFGGPLAGAVLGVLNGRRLALPGRHLLAIAGAGLACFGVRLAIGVKAGESSMRLSGAVAGLLVWVVVLALQRKAFRATQIRGVKPANLFGPGLAAFLGCGFLEAAVFYLLVAR
jgi:hypothetical protein